MKSTTDRPSLGAYGDRRERYNRVPVLQKYPLSLRDLWVPCVSSLVLGQSNLTHFHPVLYGPKIRCRNSFASLLSPSFQKPGTFGGPNTMMLASLAPIGIGDSVASWRCLRDKLLLGEHLCVRC